MSSDRVSDKPLPADKRCPHCGAALAPNARRCSMCLEASAIQVGPPEPNGRSDTSMSMVEDGGTEDNVAWVVLGALAMLLCVGMAFVAPGIRLCPLPTKHGTRGLWRARTPAAGPAAVCAIHNFCATR